MNTVYTEAAKGYCEHYNAMHTDCISSLMANTVITPTHTQVFTWLHPKPAI
jgi:hypothetical protein